MEQASNIASGADCVIIVDADYLDRTALGIAAYFGPKVGRHIEPADMAVWAECAALDGGLREGNNLTRVVLIHEKSTHRLRGFTPSDIKSELDDKAFSGRLGEFWFAAVPTEDVIGKTKLCIDMATHFCFGRETDRVIIVADTRETLDTLRPMLHDAPKEKQITLFGMEKLPEGNYRSEIIGFSLLHALGIKAEELRIES